MTNNTNQRVAPIIFYASQSVITAPREHVDFLSNLPTNIPELCKIVRGIFLHIERAFQNNIQINKENSGTYARFVDQMFAQIKQLNAKPIHIKRPETQRLIGNCRDDATLLCCLLRHINIPSRVRYGFSKYFAGIDPEFGANHVVCEYWNTEEERWVLVDPGQDEYLCEKNQLTFDPHDIPRDKFITAANAWVLCRNHQAHSENFGFGPIEPTLKGRWYIQTELVHDFAALNKMEMLLRDRWGLGDCWHNEDIAEGHHETLDKIANLILANQNNPINTDIFAEIQATYQHEDLQVPDTITCYKYDGAIQLFDLQKRKPIQDECQNSFSRQDQTLKKES